ncbi:ABC-three component system protein [Flavobacterium beibuense]|uniref:ABC-three component system protein n=1 Tax=Flavobacterium beibuense TaxID=657326 RepID=UPI003A92C929
MSSNELNNKARQYKPSTVRRLDTLSGNECANPDCSKKLIAEDGISIVSKICHIAAASKEGPRYDENMSDDERRGFDNLILLCDEHHVIIDNKANELLYPTALLKTWKSAHEKKILELLSNKNLLSKHPLALNKVINSVGRKMDEILDLPQPINAPNPSDKISFNNIQRYESVIKEFAVYQGKLNKIYEEIEREGSTKKELVLHNIKRLYINVRKDYATIEDIRKNADIIVDRVIEKMLENIDKASNKLDEFDQETVEFSLMIIIVDAFMRCNILEEPPKSVI